MSDPQFIEEGKIMHADLSPSTGEQVTGIVKEALSFPPEIVDVLKDALRQPAQ